MKLSQRCGHCCSQRGSRLVVLLDRRDFDFDFDGELSDSGYLPPPIRLFVGLRWVIGQGTLMARAAVTAISLSQPPGQGLMAEKIK